MRLLQHNSVQLIAKLGSGGAPSFGRASWFRKSRNWSSGRSGGDAGNSDVLSRDGHHGVQIHKG